MSKKGRGKNKKASSSYWQTVALKLFPGQWDAFQTYCRREGTSRSQLIRQYIDSLTGVKRGGVKRDVARTIWEETQCEEALLELKQTCAREEEDLEAIKAKGRE